MKNLILILLLASCTHYVPRKLNFEECQKICFQKNLECEKIDKSDRCVCK